MLFDWLYGFDVLNVQRVSSIKPIDKNNKYLPWELFSLITEVSEENLL
jgi:hypothetical protein